MKIIIPIIVVIVVLAVIFTLIKLSRKSADEEARKIISIVVPKVEPILKEVNLAYWNATTTGESKYYDEYEAKEIEYRTIMSDKEVFEKIKKLKERDFKDPLLKRQILELYYMALPNQVPAELNKELVKREANLEEKFASFRAKVDEEEVTDNDIREKLKTSIDLEERRTFWEASKQVGAAVAEDIKKIVELRNQVATELGFENFYEMRLEMQDLTGEELYAILDKLAEFTKKPFVELKGEIDAFLAKKFDVAKEQMRPWHYDNVFFQEAPNIFKVDIDEYVKGQDVVEINKKYYNSIGLGADDILAQSDLYEKKGKQQHAYCIDIDRKEDIRILANVKDDERWLGTMLHELGHAVYDKNLSQELPFLLREPAHTFTTEAIAMLFGRLVYYPDFLISVLGEEDKEALLKTGPELFKAMRAQMLVFARWVLVMTNFERELYRNPGQNLNELWWDMVEKYQMVRAPNGRDAPDWAAKIHIATAPVYYHNYILGEMMASQLTNYIDKNISDGGFAFVGNAKLGPYLTEKVFKPGNRMRWNDLVKNATGEYLNPKYFADQFAR